MSDKKDLLIEIGTEELPPKALGQLSAAFEKGILEGLDKAELAFGECKRFATPRRLAVLLKDVALSQADREVERRGPAVTAAFDDDGIPTKAAQGFARSCGVEVEQLETMETDKGAWLVHRAHEAGKPAAELVPGIVQESLDKLPIPKRMHWGDLDAEFVRPVHWVVMLFGDEVIDAEILTVKSGRETRGHRFHHPEALYLGEPEAYEALLLSEGRVIADFAERREAIRGQVLEAANAVSGKAVIDDDLLDEVTALVEWPMAFIGDFDEQFLDVPPEALISAMKGHQKYFHVVDADGSLLPHFIAVSNIDSRKPEYVKTGNERVIRPRLSDAEFFWNQDRKLTLAEREESLKGVVFQKKLGTLQDKCLRVSQLAEWVAERIGGDPETAAVAGKLSKADLMTEMVGEFPELQGIMGRYYAAHEKLDADIAAALDEQYMPRFAGDELPRTKTGQAVAIADRADTLVGIFGIGQIPTGNKDPFALRRATLGILRTIIEGGLDLDLRELIREADQRFRKLQSIEFSDEVEEQVIDFMMDRLRAYYLEQGVAHDTFDAVSARRPTRPLDFDQRIRAVSEFRRLPEAESLAAANKRIHNILRKAEQEIPKDVEAGLLSEAAEKQLAARVDEVSAAVDPLFAERRYEDALRTLAGLRDAVDRFFDDVMVMAEDEKVRNNRLALLKRLGDLFLRVADISKLQS